MLNIYHVCWNFWSVKVILLHVLVLLMMDRCVVKNTILYIAMNIAFLGSREAWHSAILVVKARRSIIVRKWLLQVNNPWSRGESRQFLLIRKHVAINEAWAIRLNGLLLLLRHLLLPRVIILVAPELVLLKREVHLVEGPWRRRVLRIAGGHLRGNWLIRLVLGVAEGRLGHLIESLGEGG